MNRYIMLALVTAFALVSRGASLTENAVAITNAAAQIDAAIVAKGGSTTGGLLAAPEAIAALPSGGGFELGYTNGAPVDAMFVYRCQYNSQSHSRENNLYDIDLDSVVFTVSLCFKYCYNITNLVLKNCITTDSDSFWAVGNGTAGVSFYLPSLKTLGRYTFEECKKLTVVDIPNVTAVNEANAFYGANASTYGGTKVYFTNQTYSATAPWSNLPWGGGANIWFYFANGVVKNIDGVWTLTTE